MATDLYNLTVPVYLRGFAAMAGFLEKGRAHADAQGMPHAELLEARLYEDMAPLTSQVQRASDSAKFVAIRIGQVENVAMEDTEASFAELQHRIARTVAFLKAVPREAIDGREDADVELVTPNRTLAFKGRDYVMGFALPNFYFHVTTAYAILRMKGVPVGKRDFLGGL
jgi:hypothetical protein